MKLCLAYIILIFNLTPPLRAADAEACVEEISCKQMATESLLFLMEEAITKNSKLTFTVKEMSELCREIKMRLDKGANPNTANRLNGSSALHFAAMGMDLDLIEYLVRQGVDVNIQVPKSLLTPLHFAAMQAHPCKNASIEQNEKIKDTISLFLLLGANGSLKCSRDQRAVEYITEWTEEGPHHGPIFDYLYYLESRLDVELLAEYVLLKKNSILMRVLLSRIYGNIEAFISLMQTRNHLIENGLILEVVNHVFILIDRLALRAVKEEGRATIASPVQNINQN